METRLNLAALLARREAPGPRAEAQLEIGVGSCHWGNRDEAGGDVRAASGSEVAVIDLRLAPVVRIPVADRQLAERHSSSSAVDDVEMWLDLVVVGRVRIGHAVLKSQRRSGLHHGRDGNAAAGREYHRANGAEHQRAFAHVE